ncbi:MAG TPA: RagB/SusD family nutrient uptake outer membrane protein, partial [Bacteroidales bacterium]|nr:RagB/SusD family nutrient uptake outer membrane protein [Bacteroidales bacterium]
MKKIVYIIFAAVLLMGCEDFLEQKPLTQKTSANFPQSAEDAKQMMAGIYTTMNNEQRFVDRSYFFVCEVASDDKLGGGGVNDVKAQAIENFMYSDPEMLGHAWEQAYEGIHRANFAIENLDMLGDDVISQDQKNQYKGEALFLRAWFYYRLNTLFNEVPLKITTEPANLPAASSEELYAQMATDLKTAIEIMPKNQYNSVDDGKVTPWAAQA